MVHHLMVRYIVSIRHFLTLHSVRKCLMHEYEHVLPRAHEGGAAEDADEGERRGGARGEPARQGQGHEDSEHLSLRRFAMGFAPRQLECC